MQIKKELGKNIQKYRKLNKITQEKLAELVEVEINSISSVETGRYFPSPENLVKIALALNVSLSDLFNFAGEKDTKEYIDEINKNINLIKDDRTKLKAIDSFIKSLF